MKVPSRRIITGDKPKPENLEAKNVCHQGTKARKIFIVLFFPSVLVPSWQKEISFATKNTKINAK